MAFDASAAHAARLDADDPLSGFRNRFLVTDPDLIYLDRNSLGRLPLATADRVARAVHFEWGEQLIRSWGQGWLAAPGRTGDKIGRLVGAAPGQVLVADSTSVNLFKLALAALALRSGRPNIVTDALNFPSDLYVLQGCVRLLGDRHRILVTPADRDNSGPDLGALYRAIDGQAALVTLSYVLFKSGYLYDAAAVTAAAHEAGALVLWDLSHSAGVVPVELDAWGVDFAVGCTYKYLNGGPGAPAYLYVRHNLQDQALSPIWGWLGRGAPFAFELDYAPAPGIGRCTVGTPPILSLLAMEESLDLVLEAGIDRLRVKSERLTVYLIELFDARLAGLGFSLGTPRDPARRGSHVSVRHPEGYRINRALIEELNVIPDFREPDNIRLGLSPLTTSFSQVWEGVDRLRRAITEGRYLRYPSTRLAVT